MSATAPRDSAFWHPFADMGVVRSHELVIDRAEGLYVWDEAGTRYLDATASLWYANVGHGREEIVQAVADQLRRLDAYSTFGDFANRPALELTEALAARAPMPGAKVFLTSGGGDSIETAAKLAQRYFHERGEPDRTVVLSRTAAYHGTHGFGTSLGGIQANRIAAVRKAPLERVLALIRHHTDSRALGVLGEPGVNVLQLNLAVDKEFPLR